jgi:hypothetical protein
MQDFSLQNNQQNTELLIINDTLLMFVQELDVIFNIKPYEFISEPNAGMTNIESILFNRSVNANQISQLLHNEINANTEGSKTYTYTVDVKFAKGSVRDIIIIDVTIMLTKQQQQEHQSYVQRYIFK